MCVYAVVHFILVVYVVATCDIGGHLLGYQGGVFFAYVVDF